VDAAVGGRWDRARDGEEREGEGVSESERSCRLMGA